MIDWGQAGILVGVLSPLAGVPLVMITLYLRAIREHQTNGISQLTQRLHTMEITLRDLLKRMAEFDREYATKEEWVRESMLARQRLEHLTEVVTRIEAELETNQGLAAETQRAAVSLADAVRNWPAMTRASGQHDCDT
jgi:hypothetical protein